MDDVTKIKRDLGDLCGRAMEYQVGSDPVPMHNEYMKLEGKALEIMFKLRSCQDEECQKEYSKIESLRRQTEHNIMRAFMLAYMDDHGYYLDGVKGQFEKR